MGEEPDSETSPTSDRAGAAVHPAGLRLRLASVLALLGLFAVLVSAQPLLHHATRERDLIAQYAGDAADTSLDALEAEVGSAMALLRGLSTSPALLAGDLAAYDRQLKSTPVPDHTWLVVTDLERQRINTRRPWGSPLPLTNFNSPRVARIWPHLLKGEPQILGYGRNPVFHNYTMGLTLPVMQAGKLRYVLVYVLSPSRLNEIVSRRRLPGGWWEAVLDAQGAVVARSPRAPLRTGEIVAAETLSALAPAGPDGMRMMSLGGQVWVTRSARSADHGWTTVVALPPAAFYGPQRNAWALIAAFMGGLFFVVIPGGWWIAGRLERPLATLAAFSRQRAESAERTYGTYWRDTPESLFTVGVTPSGFVFEGLNPAHEARTGLKSADLKGRTPAEVLPADMAAAIDARYRQCVLAGRPITYDETLELPGGRRHWETSLAPLRNERGEIHMLLGSARDVTERVEMQRVLAAGEERFRRVAELIPDILFTLHPDGRPQYVGPQFFEYTGLDAEADAEAILACVHPEDLAPLEEAHPLRREIRIRARDGGFRWFQLRADRVLGPDGPTWYGVATDIDAPKRAADQIMALNDHMESVLSSISDCYYTLDRRWRVTKVNPQALEWFGLAEADLLGADLRARIAVSPGIRRAMAGVLARRSGAQHLECPSNIRSGTWIELHVYPSTEGASIFFRDVTARRRGQQEVEAARALLQGSLDAMSAEVALIDERGRILAVNDAWRRALKSRAGGGAEGGDYCDAVRPLIPDFDRPAVVAGLRGLLAGKRRSFKYAYVQPTQGALAWRQLRINSFRDGEALRLIAVHEDVTEVAQAQAELRETSERLLSIQDEERQRIAVELHDSTSQHLVALGLGVARLRRMSQGDSGPAPVLEDMAGSLDEALKEIRLLSYLFNPPDLAREGLEAAVRRFVSGFAARAELSARLELDGPLDQLDPVTQRALLRVAQEGLSNVHRHAAAASVEVRLSFRKGVARLTISDDGRGPGSDPEGVFGLSQLGVGIPGMKARLAQLGGELSLRAGDVGAILEAVIPIAPRRSREAPARRAKPPAARAGDKAKAARPRLRPAGS